MPAVSLRIDWPAVQAASAWRLAVPRTPLRGRVGERLGSGVGNSLEFQDYRPYVPGDDLRYVDWTAYARSEVLSVRLYHEEVAPRIDLILDTSRSMAVTEDKLQAYGAIVGLLAFACTATDADARMVTAAASAPEPLHRPMDVERVLVCDGELSALELPHLPLRKASVRVVISDFLFPHDADVLVRRLARDGASLALIQMTLGDEAEPDVEGARRLIDVEGHGQLDVVIDASAVQEYRARFGRLRLGLSQAARRTGATFSYLVAGSPLREMARQLATTGVLEPL
jgi:uncharacterized protein (DUF58 family)